MNETRKKVILKGLRSIPRMDKVVEALEAGKLLLTGRVKNNEGYG